MKTTKFIYKICAILILCALVNACWKPTYWYEYIEEKEYCVFKEGSYWIYQDSITNNMDSVALMQSLLEIREINGELKFREVIEFYTGEYCHYLSDTSIFLPYELQGGTSGGLFVIAFNSGIKDAEKNMILSVPFDPGGNFLFSYNIGENTFYDVRIFTKKNAIRDFPDYSIKGYWAKNIGLIRYEIYNSDNKILNAYNLIKYNIKPYKP